MYFDFVFLYWVHVWNYVCALWNLFLNYIYLYHYFSTDSMPSPMCSSGVMRRPSAGTRKSWSPWRHVSEITPCTTRRRSRGFTNRWSLYQRLKTPRPSTDPRGNANPPPPPLQPPLPPPRPRHPRCWRPGNWLLCWVGWPMGRRRTAPVLLRISCPWWGMRLWLSQTHVRSIHWPLAPLHCTRAGADWVFILLY